MPTAAPGRNDPCPCGSGRKFKQCCLEAWAREDSARIRIRTREGNVVTALLDYIARTWGDPLIHAAWEEFFLWDDVPPDLMAIPEFPTMFVPWLTLGYVPDVDGDNVEEVAAAEWPQEPIGLHWLNAEMPDLDAGEREYIRIACDSPMSAFVVEAVMPGRSVDLKDILTGRRFHCLEQAGTETFRPNQLAFARIVTMDDTSVMLGTAPWVIPNDWHTRVIDFREALAATRLMTREELFEHELAIRNLYLEITGEILNPEPPRLTNTDGDPMEGTSLTYDVDGSLDHIVESLAPLKKVKRAVEFVVDEAVRSEDGHLASATITWLRRGKRKGKGTKAQDTVLGTISLSLGRLVAEVNSAKRARTLQAELTALLETRVRLIDTKVTDMTAAMAEARAARESGVPVSDAELEPEPPEFAAMKTELLQQQVMSWLEEKIPALGGKTPRQAARTAGGRERLDALLRGYEDRVERIEAGSGRFVRDLRKKLGL